MKIAARTVQHRRREQAPRASRQSEAGFEAGLESLEAKDEQFEAGLHVTKIDAFQDEVVGGRRKEKAKQLWQVLTWIKTFFREQGKPRQLQSTKKILVAMLGVECEQQLTPWYSRVPTDPSTMCSVWVLVFPMWTCKQFRPFQRSGGKNRPLRCPKFKLRAFFNCAALRHLH